MEESHVAKGAEEPQENKDFEKARGWGMQGQASQLRMQDSEEPPKTWVNRGREKASVVKYWLH